MGQKVNPHGLRVGVIKDWDSRWFADGKDFADNLVEDYKIRNFLKKRLEPAGISKIEIERAADRATLPAMEGPPAASAEAAADARPKLWQKAAPTNMPTKVTAASEEPWPARMIWRRGHPPARTPAKPTA